MLTVGEPSRGVTYQDVWHPACPATRSKRKSGLKVWPKDGLSDTVSAQAWNFANFSSLTGFDPTTAARTATPEFPAPIQRLSDHDNRHDRRPGRQARTRTHALGFGELSD